MNWLSKIPQDKLLHSFYGTLIYLLISYVDSSIALGVVAIVALSKEIYDEKEYGGFDWKDMVATVAIPTLFWMKEVLG